jgi:adenylylsulfate kinase
LAKDLEILPAVIFLTGLSGSGKTTIAHAVQQMLKVSGINPVVLDGDEIRDALRFTGFDEESRKKNNLNIGRLASLFERQGNVVIVALIAPYSDIRACIRKMCKRFVEVYVSTAISVCMERDQKGLYARAVRGEITDFTGISAPYFPPDQPELVIDTAVLNVRECAEKILAVLKKTK